MIHVLMREQRIPAAPEKVWAYFATPRNLNEMTPPEMRFEILRGGDGAMRAGQLIEYRIQLLPGLRVRWLTEIRHVRAGEYFVDEQRRGPYRFWYHEHSFDAIPGGTRMTDRVTYEVPGGLPGEIAQRLFVGPRLAAIFDYRRERVIALFGEMT